MINTPGDNILLSAPEHIYGVRLEPIVDLFSRQIISYEVLSRLAPQQDPEAFFAQLPTSDKVTLFCHQVGQLKSLYKPGKYFLNLPLEALIESRHFERLLDVCAPWVTIEIQDASFFDSLSLRHKLCLRERIGQLRQQRIAVWLDDLCEHSVLPFYHYGIEADGVKIDKQAFWRLSNHPPALRQLVNQCKGISAQIIIEGIEDAVHLEVARESGARFGQGYLWPYERWLHADLSSL